MFEHHVREIEMPDFQIQFVALSGLSVLQLMLSNHANVKSLLADMATARVRSQVVYKRILYLLPLVATEKETSYDGSVVTYLYCLAVNEPDRAYQASLRILKTKGLFWSRQLARAFVQAYQKQEIAADFEYSSEEGEPFAYALTEHDFHSFRKLAHYSCFLVVVEESPVSTRRFETLRALSDRVALENVPFGPSTGKLIRQENTYPTLNFAIA